MTAEIQTQLEFLPSYLSGHLLLTITALAVGIGFGLPVAVLVTRVRMLQAPVLALASVVQTIPSIALLALMVGLYGQIGFIPAAIALTLYSILPVVRNTVTGIDEVDASLIEAGRGLGMTPTQLLFSVQLPLAMPVIIAGIRTATVWVVGIATLSTPVGATSLGNYIFSGLQTNNPTALWFGIIAAATLALVLDGLIRLMQIASQRRSKPLAFGALAGVVLVLGGGLTPTLIAQARADNRPAILVGAKTFTEQYILAAAIADQLEQSGYRAQTLESLGSTVVFDALAADRIDVYVDYTGTIWANYMDRTKPAAAEEVLDEVKSWLSEQHEIELLGRLGFENTYALAMRRSKAEELNIETIDDLFRHSADMTIGGDYEFFGRPEWQRLLMAYELEFADTVGMDSTLMYSAVAEGELDIIAAFSTDGRIAANDLVVLDDPRSVFPPYDAVILLGPGHHGDNDLRTALKPLLQAIDVETMREANMHVDVKEGSVASAAEQLLTNIEPEGG